MALWPLELHAIIILALLVLLLKGTNADGQGSFFGQFIEDHIEETSISLGRMVQSSTQLAEINSFAAGSQNMGQGGAEQTADPSVIQGNSVLAYNPPANDYIETLGFKHHQIVEYTVQAGDTFSFIASDYGVSVSSILWANNLSSSDILRPGQVLKIPPVSGIIYKVKRGDSIQTLAKKYGIDEGKIIAFNDLPKDGRLSIDDEIVIPDAQAVSLSTSTTQKPVIDQRFSYLPDLGDYFMIPSTGFNWGRIHGRNGVDMANACNTPIYAAADGAVEVADAAGWNGGFGEFIKILHPNGTETLYAHAKKLLIQAGDSVIRGQLIALMGSTGHSTGCHLHFEVHGAKNPLAK